jgi:WD40 repeat protein
LWVHVGDHVRALAFSPDGQWLATAAEDSWLAPGGKPNHVTIWNSKTGKLERTWDVSQPALQVLFSPSGDNLASVDQNGRIQVWDFRKGTLLYSARGGILTYSPDGKLWVAGSVSGKRTIEIHDAATGKLLRTIDAGGFAAINALAITPSGVILAGGCSPGSEVCDGSVSAWNLDSGKLVKNYPHGADAFSPDGQWKATTEVNGESGNVKVTGLSEDAVKWSFTGRAAVFSLDWKEVALTQGNTISLRSLETGSSTQTLTGGAWPLAFSPDGKRLAAANYSLETHKAITCNSAHTSITTWYSLIKIWDVTTGRELLTLGGETPQ